MMSHVSGIVRVHRDGRMECTTRDTTPARDMPAAMSKKKAPWRGLSLWLGEQGCLLFCCLKGRLCVVRPCAFYPAMLMPIIRIADQKRGVRRSARRFASPS